MTLAAISWLIYGQCGEGREQGNLQGLVLLADSTSNSRFSPVTQGCL